MGRAPPGDPEGRERAGVRLWCNEDPPFPTMKYSVRPSDKGAGRTFAKGNVHGMVRLADHPGPVGKEGGGVARVGEERHTTGVLPRVARLENLVPCLPTRITRKSGSPLGGGGQRRQPGPMCSLVVRPQGKPWPRCSWTKASRPLWTAWR